MKIARADLGGCRAWMERVVSPEGVEPSNSQMEPSISGWRVFQFHHGDVSRPGRFLVTARSGRRSLDVGTDGGIRTLTTHSF